MLVVLSIAGYIFQFIISLNVWFYVYSATPMSKHYLQSGHEIAKKVMKSDSVSVDIWSWNGHEFIFGINNINILFGHESHEIIK